MNNSNLPKVFFSLTILFVVLLGGSAMARSVPTPLGKSVFEASIVRNFDKYDAHWGGNVGYCWQGRADLRLDYRGDGFPGEKRWSLQGEFALIKNRGFILESGFHLELRSETSRLFPMRNAGQIHIIPVRMTFPIKVGGRLFIMPSLTYWHILKENYGAYGFVGLDILLNRRFALGAELNVNQDFRYHNLDIRFGVYW